MSETSPPTRTTTPLEFHGSGGEYFRIWIVNLCLTIVTFGIYTAWAKVRRNRYFWASTRIAGAGLEYLEAIIRSLLKPAR